MHQIRRWVSLIFIFLLALPLAVLGQARWSQGGSIEIGQTITGELSEGDLAIAYTLDVEADTTVVITLRSNDFDTYLSLRDADDVEIAFDDDSAGNLDSRIGPFTFETAGTYTIVATSYAYRVGRSGTTGQYDLSVIEAQQRGIEYRQTLEGELTSDELEAFFIFTGARGDSVVITLMSSDFDSYLILLGTSGFEIGRDDDGAGNLNSRIGPFILPETGTYTINASSFSRNSTGRFTLSLDRVETQTIEFDEKIAVEFDGSANTVYFVFEADAGDVIDVIVEGDVDTNLSVFDPYNYRIAFDENSGGRFNPEILDLALNVSGTYSIALTVTQPGSAGSVELMLERAEVPMLNDGPITLTFSDSQYTSVVRYEADGSPVRLTLTALTGTFSPSLDISYGRGFSDAYLSGNSVQEISMVITPPPGMVTISVSDYSWSTTSAELVAVSLSD